MKTKVPDEILTVIFTFLDISDFKSVLVTCRRFFNIINSSYMKKFITTNDYRSELTKMIHDAVNNRDKGMVLKLMKEGNDFVDEIKEKIVVEIQPFDDDILKQKKIIISNDVIIDEPNRLENHFTSLHFATKNQDIGMVKLLLRCGSDSNRKDFSGLSLLHFAVSIEFENESDQEEIIRELLDSGADPECTNLDGKNVIVHSLLRRNKCSSYMIDRCEHRSKFIDIRYDPSFHLHQEEKEDTKYDRYGFQCENTEIERIPSLLSYRILRKNVRPKLKKEWMVILSQSKNFNICPGFGKSLKQNNQVTRLIRKGIPHELRGIIYPLLFPIEEYKKKYNSIYNECLRSSKNAREVEATIRRVYFRHELFGTKYSIKQRNLFRVCMAYSEYDKNLCCFGCCGMVNYASILLMVIDDEETVFMLLAFIFNGKKVGINSRKMKSLIVVYDSNNKKRNGKEKTSLGEVFFVFQELLRRQSPRLDRHIQNLGVVVEHFGFALFSRILLDFPPFEMYMRIFDIILCEGFDVVYGFVLAFIEIEERRLLNTDMGSVISSFRNMQLSCDVEEYFKLSLKKRPSKSRIESLKRSYYQKK